MKLVFSSILLKLFLWPRYNKMLADLATTMTLVYGLYCNATARPFVVDQLDEKRCVTNKIQIEKYVLKVLKKTQ